MTAEERLEEYKCPNCGKPVDINVNGYCSECSARFGRWGMYTHIDIVGNLSNGENT